MAIQSNETLKGLDYYSAATDTQLQCFKNNGISFVCRYYTSNTTRLSNGRTAIKNYFLGVQDAMNEYYQMNGQRWIIGVYGGYYVVKELDGYAGISKTWQTSSWSDGKDYVYRNIYQYQHNVSSCNVNVDYNASDGSHGGFKL
ncbi:MAG: hypothetical protein ACH0QD_13560 [Tepidibacillus sp.]